MFTPRQLQTPNDSGTRTTHSMRSSSNARQDKPNPVWRQLSQLSHQSVIQTKLTVGEPDDEYEQEADAVAEKVMRMPAAGEGEIDELEEEPLQVQSKPQITPFIQRLCTTCEEHVGEGDEPLLQAKTDGAVSQASVSPSVANTINTPGSGSPLNASVRARVEPVLGADLSGVRVHIGACSQQASRSINARAFTHQNNIFLGSGQSATDTELMAHEVTHVVQQSGQTVPHGVNTQTIAPLRQSIQRKVDPATCRNSRINKQTKCDQIESDNYLAMRYIAQAMAGLSTSKYSARVKKALKCYFNINNYQHKKTLINNLQLIQTWLSIYKTKFFYEKGYAVGCKTTAEGKPVAYARPATWNKGRIIAYGPIGICPIYHNLGQPRRVRTLIHEQAHVVGFVPRSGTKELRVGSRRRKLLPPAKLLKSADGYAHFVIAVATGKFSGC